MGNTDMPKSAALYERACKVLPGGNTRHTLFFPPHPPYAERAEGARVWDIDGNERVDFINNYSSLIHGHLHPQVMSAVQNQMASLVSVAFPTESEILLAESLSERVASTDLFRFVNSGTEALLYGIKAARAYTGRPKVAKVEGCYHGGYDPCDVSLAANPDNWGSAERPNSVSLSAGTPQQVLDDTLVIPFNDIKNARALIEEAAPDLAVVIVDPCPSRVNFISIEDDYLHMLREVTEKHGILLLMDEIFSFRLGRGGVQGNLGISPDLTTFGKIIGGGFPIGAVGGTRDVMSVFDFSSGDRPNMFHGGTFNANPLTMVAGHAALELLTDDKFQHLDTLGTALREQLTKALKDTETDGQVYGKGSLTGLRLTPKRASNFREYITDDCDVAATAKLHRYLLDHGVLSTQTGLFIASTIMTLDDIASLVDVVKDGLKDLAS